MNHYPLVEIGGQKELISIQTPLRPISGRWTLLGAPGLTTSNKKLPGAPGIAANGARSYDRGGVGFSRCIRPNETSWYRG